MSGVASSPRFARLLCAAAASFPLFLAGCGNQYRPVVTATNPVGPAAQPTKYAVVIADPGPATPGGPSAPGLLTFIDFSGDTVLSTPSIQTNPSYLAISQSTSQGFTINRAGTLDSFSAGNPTGLLTANITQTTLPAGSAPTSISPIGLAGPSGATVFVPEQGTNRVAALNNSGQLVQDISVPATPVYVVGADGTSRVYVLSSNGTASAIESSTGSGLSVTNTITVGANPVYGVMTPDARRAFVMNKGSQSVSVINVVNNALDTGVGTGATVGTIAIPTVTDAAGNNLAANPVWADLNPLTSELVVLSAGDGTHGGLLSVINIPLCNPVTQTNNPNCTAANPVDATGFGTVLEQVPVGVNAAMVSVLRDPLSPRAYVANSGSATTAGSVSVVNLNAGVLAATIPTIADTTNLATADVFGLHPATIAATVGDPTGKVYVTSPDSRYLTVIYTESDTVLTHIPLQGNGVRVVMTAP